MVLVSFWRSRLDLHLRCDGAAKACDVLWQDPWRTLQRCLRGLRKWARLSRVDGCALVCYKPRVPRPRLSLSLFVLFSGLKHGRARRRIGAAVSLPRGDPVRHRNGQPRGDHDWLSPRRPPPHHARAAAAAFFLSISATLSMAAGRMSHPSESRVRVRCSNIPSLHLAKRARAVQRAH